MLEFFSVIFIVSLVLSIIFWRKFNKTKDPNVRKKAIYSSIPLAISFIIIGANADKIETADEDVKVSAESKEDEVKEKPKKETKEETEEKPKTPEERMTNFINKKLGKKTNMKVDRVVHVQKFGEAFEVLLYADENLTTNLFYKGMLYDAATIFEELQTYDDVTGDVLVAYNFELVDTYGNKTDEKILSIRLTQDVLDKIAFDNFNVDNFEKLADVFFVHPAVK